MAAATDQTYRKQGVLDYVFAGSCVLLLISTVWMFVQDFYREFKPIQREFRNVEEAIAQRAVLDYAPNEDQLKKVEAAEDAVVKARAELDKAKDEVRKQVAADLPDKIKKEDKYRAIKADHDSVVSLYDIAVEERNAAEEPGYKASLTLKVNQLGEEVKRLKKELGDAQVKLDEAASKLDKATQTQRDKEAELSKAEDALKKLTVDFDRFGKLAEAKRWGWGDSFRQLFIIDAFNSPTKIQQYTLDQLPIDYNFKYATRFDRCTTCHLGVERSSFAKDDLAALGKSPSKELQQKLDNAKTALKKRQEISKNPDLMSPNDLSLKPVALSPAQITQYAAHPRLDLFVDGNSPHPGEKFGCTICHAGQGSATDFFNASHTPTDSKQQAAWKKAHDWHPNHYWDFPMLPNRFIESSCVKCHHQMTDLIRDGSRIEAPKLMRGYTLVKENGCFGCHEIAGINKGRWVGPDLRLEPDPPLADLSPAERAKALSDPLNPPGTMRKVGPYLRRISEKTNEEWARRWLHEPRNFRPDTKMPHFYGLTNNQRDVLPTDQQNFPDAEIHAVVHYIFQRSQGYLNAVVERHKDPEDVRRKDQELYTTLSALIDPTLEQKQQLREVNQRIGRRAAALPVAQLQLPPVPADAKEQEQQRAKGRQLFSEKGCLACHMHNGTTTPGLGLPAISSAAQFGPNLSRLAAKLGTKPGDVESARKWLVQWITNPNVHSPRTRMPITHLDMAEANDIAAWLLSQKVDNWKPADPAAPDLETLKNLARVSLSRTYTKSQVDQFLGKDSGIPKKTLDDLQRPFDHDDRELEVKPGDARPFDSKLKMFIGKKAIGQLGCYACHYIPGFHEAKPIGTPLNDWGKKDPERLAFEDVSAFVKKTYQIVPRLINDKGQAVVATEKTADGQRKELYEKYFFDLLDHHQREGFLFQKLNDPRSFDYDRLRAWDDRLRMPQFRFARSERHKGESDTAFEARMQVEEAEAREAVMTFILGLVAEPIPMKYVHQPDPQRLAEVKGRQVLEKFNCGGCHLVRPGVYEFKTTDDNLKGLEANYNTAKTTFPSDHFFADSNAWNGLPPPRPDRLRAFGLRKELPAAEEGQPPDQLVWLTEALRFSMTGDDGKTNSLNIPAASTIILPRKLLTATDNYGGTFGDLLVGFLMQKDKQRFSTDDKARPAVPPALIREGEKTQPGWLFGFLREPIAIRPVATLRMPKFNMSDEDAMQLVNYFSAADKVGNPAAGLSYPYLTIPEKDENYIREQTARYVQRLKQAKAPNKQTTIFEQRLEEMQPVWQDELKRQLFDTQAALQDSEAQLKRAEEADPKKPPEEIKKLQEIRDALKKDVERAQAQLDKKDIEPFRKHWEEKEAYLIDGFRLLASEAVCRNCHQVGNLPPKEQQGPHLSLTWQRLRPDWTLRWLANPQRYMTYPTPMPQNFSKIQTQFQDLFHGVSMEQVTGARDALMNYPQLIEMPANRQRPAVVAGTGGK